MGAPSKTTVGLLAAGVSCLAISGCVTPLAGPAVIIRYSQLGACAAPAGNGGPTGAFVVFEIDAIDNSQSGHTFNFDPTKLYFNGSSPEYLNANGAVAQSLFGPRQVKAQTVAAGKQPGLPPASLGVVFDQNTSAAVANRVNYFLNYNSQASDPPILVDKLNSRRGSWPNTSTCSQIYLRNGFNAYTVNQLNPYGTPSTISTYSLDPATGALAVLAGKDAPATPDVADVAISPTGRFLFTTNGNEASISSYAIDPNDGALTLLQARAAALPDVFPAGLVADTSGRFLYAVNRGGASVYGVNTTTGALTQLQGPIPALGSSGGSAGVSHVVLDSSGQFLYVLSSNAALNTIVLGAKVDANTGLLTALPGPLEQPGGFGALIAASPSGPYLYVLDTGAGEMHGYAINTGAGALSPVPGTPVANQALVFAADMAIDPTGGSIYTVGGYGVDLLTVGGNGFATFQGPAAKPDGPNAGFQFVEPDATGRFLYAPWLGGGSGFDGFAMNPTSGALTKLPSSLPFTPYVTLGLATPGVIK